MDDNNNPDDVRRSLYEEFLSEVVKAGNPEAYFDEADLVEIFDYSSDMDNYIAKMEVLFYGARHYPDSQPLATRRAWFYSSFGEMEAAAELNNRVSNGGVLNELLRLRASDLCDFPEIEHRLDSLVETTADFGDEELIQLVDYCAENGMLPWVEKNYERIKSKCSYPQTFIYEYANRCEDGGEPARAVSLFEELTMLEPFTLDFWERLAGAQYRAEQYEDAISSADYALAIGPDSADALRAKGMSLYALRRDMAQVIELMSPLMLRSDMIESDLSVLVGALVESGRPDQAADHIIMYLDSHAASRESVGMLLALRPEAAAPYMRQLDSALTLTGSSLLDWAAEEYAMGQLDLAQRIIGFVPAHLSMTPAQACVVAEILFANDLFDRAIDLCVKSCATMADECLSIPGFGYAYVMSLIRRHRPEDAVKVATEALQSNLLALRTTGRTSMRPVATLSPVGHHLLLRGYLYFLYTVIHDLTAPDHEIDYDRYMPGPGAL